MELIIKRADLQLYSRVREFYHSVIDGIQDAAYGAGWKKDIYPSPSYLSTAIKNGELYIATKNEEIIGSMVLNHEGNEGYRQFQWPTKAETEEIMVIHALGIHPLEERKGYAKKMVRFAIDLAKKEQQKVIRLDVLKGNLPAEKLYEGLGFKYLHTIPLFYDDTGWTEFKLYEFNL